MQEESAASSDFQDQKRVSVTIFMVKMSAPEHLKMEGFLEFLSNFIEANKKFKIKYHNSKLFKKFETISAQTKFKDLIF